jgi:hypothetical protein
MRSRRKFFRIKSRNFAATLGFGDNTKARAPATTSRQVIKWVILNAEKAAELSRENEPSVFVPPVSTRTVPSQLAAVLGKQLQKLPLLRRQVVPLVRHTHLSMLVRIGRAPHAYMYLMLGDEPD